MPINCSRPSIGRRAALLLISALAAAPVFALYDPTPDAALAAAQGSWHGTLTYRDYSNPDKQVTLATSLYVALSAPSGLTLNFVFDDGPGKTVYSYDQMMFDFARGEVAWTSGIEKPSTRTYRIASSTSDGHGRALVMERATDAGMDRYRMRISADQLEISKFEVGASGTESFRNRYVFSRQGR